MLQNTTCIAINARYYYFLRCTLNLSNAEKNHMGKQVAHSTKLNDTPETHAARQLWFYQQSP